MIILLGFNSKLALIKLFKGGLGLLCQVICNLLHLGLELGEVLLQCRLILGLCLNVEISIVLILYYTTKNCCLIGLENIQEFVHCRGIRGKSVPVCTASTSISTAAARYSFIFAVFPVT